MMGEFDSSSTIKYMIGPSMIKYQVLDDLFKNGETKIYTKGYIDRKGRLILNKRVENQEW